MKNIFTIVSFLLATCATAQVAIGKPSITLLQSPPSPPNTVNPSISLEFGDYVVGQGKGLVLPWVNSAAATVGSVAGTVIYDVFDKIVKYRNGTGVNDWFALSKNETTVVGTNPTFNTVGVVDTTLQDGLTDASTAKVSIGTQATPDVPGILVLETNNQAMILPKMPSPHLNITNPEPGTMAYDTTTKQLAVYNGKVWSFWKP